MSAIIWQVVGGLAGWIASLMMRMDTRQGLLTNVVGGDRRRDSRRRGPEPAAGPGDEVNHGDFSPRTDAAASGVGSRVDFAGARQS